MGLVVPYLYVMMCEPVMTRLYCRMYEAGYAVNIDTGVFDRWVERLRAVINPRSLFLYVIAKLPLYVNNTSRLMRSTMRYGVRRMPHDT